MLKWYESEKSKGTVFNSVTGGLGPTVVGGAAGATNGIDGAARPDNFKLADELIQELAYHS